jgi:N-acetylmuramoyl-L-alanine amidase-like protein
VPLIPRNLIELRAGRIEDPIERLRFLNQHAPPAATVKDRSGWRGRKLPLLIGAILAISLLIPGYKASNTKASLTLGPVAVAPGAGMDVFKDIWVVDKTSDFETYSNGLRIDNHYAVSNQSRVFYPVYHKGMIEPSEPEWRSEPAGIVYHTTESDQARFDADQNRELKLIGKQVLTFIKQNRCYHFLIDRFGQVFRVVRESDIANHAGNSVWGDDSGIYVNLNGSFLGIAFETQTQKGEELPSANAAQVHAARILTEMLRSKYHIPSSNCVTHAQVSVNPGNMLVGYHTDWAGNFPFLEVGLNDNYTTPPASIYTFGFNYDPEFVHATGVRLWQGLAMAEDQIRTEAAARGLPLSRYRSILQKKYKEILATLRALSATKETDHAT